MVAKRTEKIIPSSVASHNVIGGNKQNNINQIHSRRLLKCGVRENDAAMNIAVGPKIYTPASIHHHLGVNLRITRVARLVTTSPVKEAELSANTVTFHGLIAESNITGNQNANPPTAIQYSLFCIAYSKIIETNNEIIQQMRKPLASSQ